MFIIVTILPHDAKAMLYCL